MGTELPVDKLRMSDMSHNRAVPLDMIGIGFGPSNLALAIALDEMAAKCGRPLNALFLERQPDYHWHGDTLVAQSEMQISFLKDLVSLRNPTSYFSFLNYLHLHRRLIDFINLSTFYPCRMEYNDYLRWVASHLAHKCSYGEEVIAVEPVVDGQRIELLKVRSREAHGTEHVRHTRAVVVGTGGTPRIPPVFKNLRDEPRLFHHADYIKKMAAWSGNSNSALRVAVVGGGQSAAEAFIDLHNNRPEARIHLILRAAALRPADDSPFVNEIFSPAYTDMLFNLSELERERLIRENYNTNYSVVDLSLIEQIYGIFYRQKVSGIHRHELLCRRTIENCVADRQGVELTLHDYATGERAQHRYDLIILATGYERTSHRRLLAPLAEYLGDFTVDRNYRLHADERLQAPVFAQGFSQPSHGLSDTLLSVLPIRAEELATALYDRMADGYPVDDAFEASYSTY